MSSGSGSGWSAIKEGERVGRSASRRVRVEKECL